jgi:predicted amidophosphoribosyltransferase
MKKQKEKKQHLHCPYCDEEIKALNLPYCTACKVTIFYCPNCHKPTPRDKKICSYCGAEIKS